MKPFKSIAALAAGLLLAGSMMAAPALAQPPDAVDTGNSTEVSVTITDTGVFDAYFCQVLGTHSPGTSLTLNPAPTLATPGLATGTLYICYTDTMAYRPKFDTTIVATDFLKAGGGSLPASGFKIEQVYNVVQHYWGSPSSTPPQAADYGDIGQFVNNGYTGQGNPWPKAWTTNNQLNTAKTIQFGYAGVGTDWSYGQFDVSLFIPIGTQAGTYTSTMTLSIITGTQP